MRTTVRVDDELLERLKAQARRENVSLTRLLNRALKAGLQAGNVRSAKRARYRERVHSMGAPRLNLDKALAVAASLEDAEVVRELALRK
jgi:predicted DNA-binding ribbon-helix-helix protein